MNAGFAKRLRRAPIAFAHIALAFKLLIPVGCMPAAVGAGGPIKLCPSSFPIELTAGQRAHDDDGGHADGAEHEDASAWERCALGALAATPAMPVSHVLHVQHPGSDSYSARERGRVPLAPAIAFRARAPPRTLS